MTRRARLIELATEVADGSSVDWNSVRLHQDDASRAHLLEHLRLVERVAQVHQSEGAAFAAPPESWLDTSTCEELDTPATWGSLTILERIGRGTYGDVYRAHDHRLDRPVALKLMRRRESPDALDSAVIEEGRLMARVRHPNVVTIYGAERIDGRVGLWMELVSGPTLEQELRERGPFDASTLLRVGLDLCRALDAVHRAGQLHRDLKAQNAMRDQDGRVLLTDFGAGLDVDANADTLARDELAGTPLYLAPEVLDGQPTSASTDIYSLGVLLYHLATGSFPVRGRSLRELRDLHARGERSPLLRETRPDLPGALAGVIDNALRVEPSARPRSAAHMAAGLEAVQTSGARRRRVPMVLGLVAAAIVIAVASLAWRTEKASGAAADAIVSAPPRPVAMAAPVEDSAPNEPAPQTRQGVAPEFGARDWALIVPFENRTGETLLDGTLDFALERELSNSTFVNVVPRDRIDDTLRLMQKPLNSTVDVSLGREIAVRDGEIHVLLTGRIEKIGQAYVLTSQIVNPNDGVVMASFSTDAGTHSQLLPAVRRQAFRIRELLGEMLSAIRSSEAVLEKVTTTSLHALQLYSQAASFMRDSNWRNDVAQQLLERAIAVDPSFASAHILLAYSKSNQGQPREEFLPHAQRAAELANRTTDAERYFILASYHDLSATSAPLNDRAQEELRQAAALYEALLRIKPDHYWGPNNLGRLYLMLNRPAEGATWLVRSAERRHNSWIAQATAAERLLAEGEHTRARRFIEQARTLMPLDAARTDPRALGQVWLFDVREAWMRGDVTQALKLLNDVAEGQQYDRLPTVYVGLGRFEDASKAADRLPPNGRGVAMFLMMSARSWLGDPRAEEFFRGIYKLNLERPQAVPVNPFSVSEFIRQGHADFARQLVAAAKGRIPAFFRDEIEGHLALADGLLDEGVLAFRTASMFAENQRGTAALRMAWALAEALRARGDMQGAIKALENATSDRDRWVDSVMDDRGGVAYWLHARDMLADLYRATGRAQEAQAIDDNLRTLLAVADRDHPLLGKLNAVN